MVESRGERQSSAGAGRSAHSRNQPRTKFAKRFALRTRCLHSLGIHSALFSRRFGSLAFDCVVSSDLLVRAVSGRRDFCSQPVGNDLASVSEPAKHVPPFSRGRFHRD